MYENSTELAENKLLVLYVIKSLKRPITNTQLTEIILENNFINYFTLQQYISELISSDFLKYVLVNDKNLINITEKGDNVLSFFIDRISPIKKKIIDDYLLTIIDSIKRELTIHSDYTLGKNDSFLVDLKALEDDILLMELKVSVPSKKQAVSLCNRWKEDPSKIYTTIINTLFSDED
ncbi:DUF4364 family protein [Clostridium chauvoei]|uniref:DUF4364 domain-containing protein n=2 Tax=Clostridium chauvoei TaxID=46867 RepID=A0A1U6JFM6_9CLOT|nr:DUF4364 family protein [Clostridium chauvoei]ATD55293.1 hypothetical protein BTM20_08595 [Clostridium chauvoei]ATD57033.1 hypothetical protein BTM21_04445 [Clostridium chauvoei]MBX7279646.1 DUF4364 family protein [Clostridium chauvoei]MBX7282015.1 DUF4364 family protein [Clostridium chauvoei]MBX7284396.1 DUF4364 family protein [Clostridium chauvoei]